jgi:hypothetical protein
MDLLSIHAYTDRRTLPRIEEVVSVQRAGSGECRDGVAADAGVEDVGEVGEERALLEAAGDRGGEEPFDCAFALLGLAAE